jgi:hypothetical protein
MKDEDFGERMRRGEVEWAKGRRERLLGILADDNDKDSALTCSLEVDRGIVEDAGSIGCCAKRLRVESSSGAFVLT